MNAHSKIPPKHISFEIDEGLSENAKTEKENLSLSKNLKVIVKSSTKGSRRLKPILKGALPKERKPDSINSNSDNPNLLSKLVSALKSGSTPHETDLKELVSKMGNSESVLKNVGIIQNMISGGNDKQPIPVPAPQQPQNNFNKPSNYKTVPCRLFHSSAGCSFGDKCNYIHDYNFAGVETPNMNKYVRPVHMLSKGKGKDGEGEERPPGIPSQNGFQHRVLPLMGNKPPHQGPINSQNPMRPPIPNPGNPIVNKFPQHLPSPSNLNPSPHHMPSFPGPNRSQTPPSRFPNPPVPHQMPNNNPFPPSRPQMPSMPSNNNFPLPGLGLQNMIQGNNLLKNIMPPFMQQPGMFPPSNPLNLNVNNNSQNK